MTAYHDRLVAGDYTAKASWTDDVKKKPKAKQPAAAETKAAQSDDTHK